MESNKVLSEMGEKTSLYEKKFELDSDGVSVIVTEKFKTIEEFEKRTGCIFYPKVSKED